MVTSAMHGVQWRFGLGALMWLIAFAVTPRAAFADAVGTVLFVVGDVKVSTGGAPRRSLGKSDVIVEGDILATGENSSAQIKMRDGGVLAVRANTELKFDIFKIARNPGEPQSSVMSLVKGSLRAITGLIGRNNKQEYKISTAVATIGIRGTDHEAAFIPLALPGVPAGAYSKVNVGQTTLTTTAGTVLVNPNQMGFASSPNAAPQIRPVNANLFTAVPPPATASSGKKDDSGQAATTTAGGGESTQQGGQSSQQGGQTAQNENQNQGQGQPSQSQAQTQGAQAGSQSGNQAAATPTATTTTTPTTTIVPVQLTSSTLTLNTTTPTTTIVPVQLTSSTLTLNTTTQTISTSSGTTTSLFGLAALTTASSPVPPTSPTTSSSYLSNYLVPVPVSGGYTVGETIQSSSLAASAINLYGSGNLYSVLGTSYQQINGSNQIASANVIWNGGSPMDYFQSADQSITFGRWQGGAVTVINTSSPYNQLTFNLNQSGSMIGPTSSLWTYIIAPPSGYVQTLSGTSNYSKVGNTTPFDSVGGAGVLNSATLAANFTNQTVSAGLQLTMNTGPYASDVFNVSATMPINPLQSTNPSGFKVGSTPPAVSCSVGPCIGGAFTGDMRGTFAGSNAASAVLGYGIWATPSSGPPADIINGYVAFSAATPPTPSSVAAYAGGEIAVQYQSTNVGTSAYIAPASNIVVPSTSSTSPQTISFSMPASVTSDYYSNYTPTTSYAATAASVMSLPSGIRYGASPFSSYSFSSTGSYTQPLGGGGLSQWIVGPQAYFDANYQSNGLPIVAQLSYSLAGGTSPVGSRPNGTNVTGTLTSATVNANLTAQTVSASVGVTALGNTYLASASNMHFSTFSTLPSGNNYAANPFSGSAVVTNGSTCSTSTCGGYISGGFTGQNYAGALLSYNLYDSGAGISNLGGVAALSLSPSPSSSAPPTPTGNYLVGNNYYVSLANSVTGPPGVLTGYSDSDSHSSTTVTCATCAVTSTTSVTQSTGISYGRWDQGTVQSSYSYSYSYSGMGGQLYWITGPEPTPYYLPQVLTQQATYTFAGGAAGTGAGPGTVDSGSLTANFSKQTVAVNLAGTANVGTSGSPMNVSWTASTSNALIGANCSANGCFSAGSYYASTSPGYLTTTIDGQSASGNLSGQFTGANLTGAIVSFGLWPATTTIGTNSNIQGVAAFSGAGADPLTPYRLAAVLINDSAYSMGSPEIREGYQPAAAVGFDSGSRMLNQILVPPNSASGNSSTNSITTSSLSFSGGTVSPSSGFLGANSGAGTACNPCTDPVTGISWGRWSSVTVTKNDLINNIASLPTQVAGGGVHWISTPSLIGPVTLPISGTYSYVVAGGTNPTDSTGAQGVLNSAALTANFTQQTVNLGVNLSMPNAAITASASNVPIYKGAEFSTGSYSKSPLSVTCTGTACGASPQGKVGGVFVGSGGQGAVMGYGFMPNPAASNKITGVVSFRR